MMTLSQFRKHVDINTGNRDLSNEVLDQAINAALIEVSNALRFHEIQKVANISTVKGTRAYEWGVKEEGIIDIQDIDQPRRLLRLESPNMPVRDDEDDEDAQGAPERWSRVGLNIYLFPTPDDVYRLEVYFRSEHDRLEHENDATLLNGVWDQGIILGATSYVLLTLQESTLYDRWFQRFVAYMQTREISKDDLAPNTGIEVAASIQDLESAAKGSRIEKVEDII